MLPAAFWGLPRDLGFRLALSYAGISHTFTSLASLFRPVRLDGFCRSLTGLVPKADSGGAFLLSLFTSTWAAFHITVSVKQANSRLNYLLPALDWLEPLIFAVGAVVGFWAFRRCRKPGYLVIAISFCLAVFSLLALPHIKAELRARRTPAPSEETQRKINAAVSEAIERVLREEGTPPAAVERDLRFPLGPLIFVLGVWLLARREPRIERGSVLADRPAQERPAG